MILINKMLSSNSTNDDFPAACSLFFPPSPPPPPHMHLEYQDVYLEFLQLFDEEPQQDEAPAPADSKAKSAKKDRHSKINTARGPRDRRMRLSLDIARRFFHLQDLLGYDKASTTVHWLLENAGAAIAELEVARGGPTSEHSSTCEQPDHSAAKIVSRRREREREKVKKRVAVARESRRKARERARERTSQKRLLIQTQPHLIPINYDHVEEDFKKSTTNTSPLFTYDHHCAPTFFNQVSLHSLKLIILFKATSHIL